MQLRLLWHAESVAVAGLDRDLVPGARVRIGRGTSEIRVTPLAPDGELGGHTAYIIACEAVASRITHTGHIGSCAVSDRVLAEGGSLELEPGQVIELRNPDGVAVVRLALER